MINLTDIAKVIYKNKKVSILQAIDEAAIWYRKIYNADTGRINEAKLNKFLDQAINNL